jgi:CMP-N,N'-diacetyllegionaminic acid synthase
MTKEKSKKDVIYAMVPARYGSTRLKLKNLALINGEPLISYAINSAKKSGIFDKIVVNSENIIFQHIAKRYKVDFYNREENLGSSEAKSDSVIYDFINKFPEADIVAWVNPTSPLQSSNEIYDIVRFFIDSNLDSLITVEDKQVHCIYNNKPLNYDSSVQFSQTQNLKPVYPFVYSVMMWRSLKFKAEYESNNHAMFCGKFGTYKVNKLSSIIVKNKDDLVVVDKILQSKLSHQGKYKVQYDKILTEHGVKN